MKILVLQLARLGDIYQTWPTLRGLKRLNPDAEIHLVTRKRFASAAPGEDLISRHWALDTREILSPLIDDQPNIDLALQRLTDLSRELRAENFDSIINLSFSPFSSFFMREISSEKSDVRGYSRFSDGYLHITDDASAYFYSQAGVDRPNRVHVTNLLAHVAGIELIDSDWLAPVIDEEARHAIQAKVTGDYLVVHVGASEDKKTFSWPKWLQVVKNLLAVYSGQIVLVGSAEEAEKARNIANVTGDKKPIDLVGQTNLKELIEVIRGARFLVGGDSGPMQIASLVNTPVFNISMASVNFWETGPRSVGSRILLIENEDAISSDDVVSEIKAALNGSHAGTNVVVVTRQEGPYDVETISQHGFEWELLKAIYMGDAFPAPTSELFIIGMQRLADVNLLALEQIDALRRNTGNKTASVILDRVDEIMQQIAKMVPEVSPLIRWFQAERTRIGPLPVQDIIQVTENLHRRLGDIIGLYVETTSQMSGETSAEEGSGNDNIAMG